MYMYIYVYIYIYIYEHEQIAPHQQQKRAGFRLALKLLLGGRTRFPGLRVAPAYDRRLWLRSLGPGHLFARWGELRAVLGAGDSRADAGSGGSRLEPS